MAEIVQSLFAGGGQAMRLYNEQWGRRMGIGCQWGKIRVLVRYNTIATSNLNSCCLVVGVSQGQTDMFRSSNTTDFIGANLGNAVQTVTWTYQPGPPAYATSNAFTPIAVRRTGNTNTTVAPGGSITVYQNIGTRGVFGCDIEKANSVMKVRPLGVGTLALAQTDYNFGNMMFNADGDLASIPLIGHSPAMLSVPYVGGNYAFDTVNIDWNNGIQPIDIYDILVVRFF